MPPARHTADQDEVRAAVAARYAGLARAARSGQQITDGDPAEFASGGFGPAGYPDVAGLPEGAVRVTAAQRFERGGQVGCIAGAPSFAEYRAGLAAAGFTGIIITPTHQVADGVHSAIIRAARP
jgi:hypothetical protein